MRIKEKICMKIAWLLPRKIVYWCAIRLMAHATSAPDYMNEHPDSVSIIKALDRWEK